MDKQKSLGKKCTKCGIFKKASDFTERKGVKDGLKSWCKRCECEANKQRYRDNIDEKRAKNRARKRKNRKENALKCKDWREKNKEHVKEYWEKYKKTERGKEMFRKIAERQRRKKGIPIRTKMPRELYLEKANKRAKKYYTENKERVNEYKKKWEKKRCDTNIEYRITRRLRSRVYNALKGNVKSDKTINLIGCSIEKLMIHIESQFDDGMNWGNYGEWHIDHIKPCASFDLTDVDQQKQCFNYKNLQPLWAFDNMSKGASIGNN